LINIAAEASSRAITDAPMEIIDPKSTDAVPVEVPVDGGGSKAK